MGIRGEVLIITGSESKISEEPLLIRLICEFRSADDEIKTFCFRNNLNVRLHKDGNYMIDLSEQLGFIVINIEEDLVYLSLPESIDEKQKEKLSSCASFFNGNNSAILYYYKKDGENKKFAQEVISAQELKGMDLIESHLKKYTTVPDEKGEGQKVLRKV